MKDEHTTSKGNQTHGLSERIWTSAQTMQQVHLLLSVAIACGDKAIVQGELQPKPMVMHCVTHIIKVVWVRKTCP